MTYDKDTVLLEKYENYFREELTFNDDELNEVIDLAVKLERTHQAMDEDMFKAKMTRFCELITNGVVKKALINGFTNYLEGKKS